MPQSDIRETYRGQQYRVEQSNDINSVEFMTGNPTDLSDNPKRIWVEQASGSLRFTVDGSVIHDVTGALTTVTNVKDWEAKGDGITDDTDAINEAITAMLASAGRHLVIPAGIYLISQRGSFNNEWIGKLRPYCMYIQNESDFTITVEDGAEFLIDLGNPVTRSNVMVFNNCHNVRVTNWKVRGTGKMARDLYNAAALHIYSCTQFDVENPTSRDTHHNVITFYSDNIRVTNARTNRSIVPFVMGGINFDFPVPDDTVLTHAGTHIGFYSSKYCKLVGSVSYGGCDDGDIGAFGGQSIGHFFDGVYMHNYFEEDPEKKIVKTAGQGLYVDSGPTQIMIANSFADGYYFGFDNKTDTDTVQMINCITTRCMVGFAARLGEGNLPLANAIFQGCTANPNGGNGREIYANLVNGFDPDGRGYVKSPVGFWIQNCQGVSIIGNTVANNFFINETADFVPVYISNSRVYNSLEPAYMSGYVISGNFFGNEQRQRGSAESGSSTAPFLIAAGYYGDLINNPTTDAIVTVEANGASTLPPGIYYVSWAWTNAAGSTEDVVHLDPITIGVGEQIKMVLPFPQPVNATNATIYIGKDDTANLRKQGITTTDTYIHSTPLGTSSSTNPTPATTNLTIYAPVTGLTISGNNCDPKFTNVASSYPNGYFWLEYIDGLTITEHQFSSQVEGYYPFKLKACKDVLFQGQTFFQTVQGIMELDSCYNVQIVNNKSNQSTAGILTPYYRLLDSMFISITGNHLIKSGTPKDDGYFFSVEGSTDYVIYEKNMLQLNVFNPNTFGGNGFSGTLDTTGTYPKNIVGQNVFIPITVDVPANMGG